MTVMMMALKEALLAIVRDIDAGNCDATEDEMAAALDALRRCTRAEERLSKYEACKLLGVSRATFDRMVRDGRIPKGRKEQGFNELSWARKDLRRR